MNAEWSFEEDLDGEENRLAAEDMKKIKAKLSSAADGATSLADGLSIKSVENDDAGKHSELLDIPTCTFELPGSSGCACPNGANKGVEEDSVKHWQEPVISVVKVLWMQPEELNDQRFTNELNEK